MGVYKRADSPFLWMLLERHGQKSLRESTGIPWDGGSSEQNKELRRQAQEIYVARMTALARKKAKLPTTESTIGFAAYRAWYAEHVSAHKSGVEREQSMLRQLGAFFDRYELDAIDRALVQEWRTWRRRTVAAATVNREEEVLKHLLNTAVGRHLELNPIAGMPRLRAVDTETRILTRPEERRLLRAAAKNKTALAAILCGLDALMRRGSVAKLSRAQDHGTYLTLLNAKTGTYKVPVSARLRKALDAVPKTGPLYFEAYQPDYENQINRMFVELCTRAKVPVGREGGGVTFHSLRHTGASRMLEAGVDVKTVMLIGGWKNLKVLERYLHPTDDVKRAAVNTIGRRR